MRRYVQDDEGKPSGSASADAGSGDADSLPAGPQQLVQHSREMVTELVGIHLEELMAEVRLRPVLCSYVIP